MLQKLDGIPSYVAGFKATGEVTRDDYDTMLVPELERVDKEHGHIHFLMVMETPAREFSLGAWLQDAWQGIKHFRGWKKVAIVTDEKAIEKFSNVFSVMIPGQSRGFPLTQLEAAKTWVAGEA
jgi:hypothetical protein